MPDWLDSLTLAGFEHQNPGIPQLSPFFLFFLSFPRWSTWVPQPTSSIFWQPRFIKTHQLALHTCLEYHFPFSGICCVPRHLIPHPSTSSASTMPSTTHTINNKASINQMSMTQLVKTKESKHSKKVMIHQSGSPLLPDDFVLFPQDVVKEKHSSIRDAKTRKPVASKSAKNSSSLMPRHHMIESRAATSPQRESRRPSRRPMCLDHMSRANCTVDCANAKPLAHLQVPPKAPSPPRLPTPDLSDPEGDDLWSCCGSSWSSLSMESSRCNHKADSTWDEMGASSNDWPQGSRIR